MTTTERKEKRERATRKVRNQLSVLSRVAYKKDAKTVREMAALAERLSA